MQGIHTGSDDFNPNGLNQRRWQEMVMANEASWDRIARVVIGVGLLALGLLAVNGTLGIIMAVVGAILLVTGAIGWCPIYSILGLRTKPADPVSG